jgi:hypothetical protein
MQIHQAASARAPSELLASLSLSLSPPMFHHQQQQQQEEAASHLLLADRIRSILRAVHGPAEWRRFLFVFCSFFFLGRSRGVLFLTHAHCHCHVQYSTWSMLLSTRVEAVGSFDCSCSNKLLNLTNPMHFCSISKRFQFKHDRVRTGGRGCRCRRLD